ncbi:hypothetical protein M0G74_17135 [Microbulbifer sp. CAU 1566]|uniref:hypothetical protein n=1 Tax=Microbulbifer sp. CAU 1566 TaxID=2933269 RepID=UPI002005EB49|nr:hypothetical protein [Microbulbifer sp. CAU 1566]MCK7599001.1 hypothetical protein [Microbulbifer sp. CAU 1566]
MNTQLPLSAQGSAKPNLLATPHKAEQAQQNPQAKIGKSVNNLSLRYPKELERCFVLGNN